MVLTLILVTSLATLGMLTTLTVRGGIQTGASDRFHKIAVYAAESGGAAAMEFLRANIDLTDMWSAFVEPSTPNAPVPHVPTGLPGNGALPGDSGNLFSPALGAYYSVEIFNNRQDEGYLLGRDTDARVIIRSTGYGPDGAMAIIEWDVVLEKREQVRPCNVYAMKNQSEDNSGTNSCLDNIDTSQTATFTP